MLAPQRDQSAGGRQQASHLLRDRFYLIADLEPAT
jgi:hypothetical protein